MTTSSPELDTASADVAAYLRDTSSSTNPYPAYRRLRELAPVHWSEENGYWIVTGFAAAESLFRDSRMSRHEAGQRQFGWLKGSNDDPAVSRAVDAWLSTVLNLDPPEHTRLRRLASRAFTPRAVASWEPRTNEIVDDILASASTEPGPIDLVSRICYPIPEIVICEVLGVPAEDHDRWKQWSSGLNQAAVFAGRSKPGQALPAEALQQAQQSIVNWYEYFAELVGRRHGADGDDLISVLVRLEEEGDRLTEIELVGMLTLLIGAGHDTTANLIANGMLALMRHPDQYRRLRHDPSLAPGMVEEVLRYDGPARGQPRVATDDIEIAGRTIHAGDLVMVIINAANRDPVRFTEPERFDITRGDSSHLAFASGIHFCLGTALARMEATIAFRKIAELPDVFELFDDKLDNKLDYKRTHGRNLTALRVRRRRAT